MTEIYLNKIGNVLVPANESDAEIVRGWRPGEYVKCKASRPNNPRFHRKLMSLFNYGFECWEPKTHLGNIDGSRLVEKHFERFRKDVTIACGHYTLVVNIKGDVRAEADSLSFGKMDADQREALFQKVITYLIRMEILRNQTPEQVDAVIEERVNRLLEYA